MFFFEILFLEPVACYCEQDVLKRLFNSNARRAHNNSTNNMTHRPTGNNLFETDLMNLHLENLSLNETILSNSIDSSFSTFNQSGSVRSNDRGPRTRSASRLVQTSNLSIGKANQLEKSKIMDKSSSSSFVESKQELDGIPQLLEQLSNMKGLYLINNNN